MIEALREEFVWIDGEVHSANDIAIRPFTHALHYGSAVFEGIRAYQTSRGPAIFRLHEHVDRFYRSAEVYGLAIPFEHAELCNAIVDTLRANAFSSGYIRPLAFFGQRGISLAPRDNCPTHVLIALRPLSGSLIGDDPAGCRVTISPYQKTPSRSLPSTVKASGHYTNSILALQHAAARGFDEAILLNDRGQVAEGTGENVFIVRDGVLQTNDESADVLPGITRATAIELASDLGIEVRIAPIELNDLLTADEVFFTGTAAEIMPIARIDARQYAATRPITDALRAAYSRATRGEDPLHADWLSHYPDPASCLV
ncbi:MAG: branched-chain amino acid transaminase [Vulcanimicrobiaceae bacterium]